MLYFIELERDERQCRRKEKERRTIDKQIRAEGTKEEEEEEHSLGEEMMAQPQERTLRDFAVLNIDWQPLCITYPKTTSNFELKSGLIHLLPIFYALAGEDLHKHLKEFHIVCDGMRLHGVTKE